MCPPVEYSMISSDSVSEVMEPCLTAILPTLSRESQCKAKMRVTSVNTSTAMASIAPPAHQLFGSLKDQSHADRQLLHRH